MIIPSFVDCYACFAQQLLHLFVPQTFDVQSQLSECMHIQNIAEGK